MLRDSRLFDAIPSLNHPRCFPGAIARSSLGAILS